MAIAYKVRSETNLSLVDEVELLVLEGREEVEDEVGCKEKVYHDADESPQ